MFVYHIVDLLCSNKCRSIAVPAKSDSSSKRSSGTASPSSANGTKTCCSGGASSARASTMSHLVDKPDFVYADFVKFKESTQTFRASDYSWETHGFSIANRLYPEIGDSLDEKFTVAKEFTYNT